MYKCSWKRLKLPESGYYDPYTDGSGGGGGPNPDMKWVFVWVVQMWRIKIKKYIKSIEGNIFNHLTPNDHFSGRTTPLTYRCCISLFIQQIYVLNILNMLDTLRFFFFFMSFIS
jgi:hypothetical protein